jgi:phosphohistidine phosphatase
MLELLLLRHAKSRWDQPGVDDHDRELAPRGERAARRMGRLLAERRLVPDRVLCSTARRAARTWELAAAELGGAPEPVLDRALYLATPERLLEAVRRRGGDARRLLVVGHNPGMHAFATLVAADGAADARARLAAKFPTAALAQVAVDAPSWSGLATGSGRLAAFWRPRDLG